MLVQPQQRSMALEPRLSSGREGTPQVQNYVLSDHEVPEVCDL